MNIYTILVHIHSGLRWLVLLFIILTIVDAAIKLRRKADNEGRFCFSNRYALVFMHLQLIIGLILYFISPKVVFSAASMKETLLRFFLVEHIALMVIAVILVTIGYVRSKRGAGMKKYKSLIIYYTIALLLILAAIPWPFRNLGAGWF
jgi:hypothetical protein